LIIQAATCISFPIVGRHFSALRDVRRSVLPTPSPHRGYSSHATTRAHATGLVAAVISTRVSSTGDRRRCLVVRKAPGAPCSDTNGAGFPIVEPVPPTSLCSTAAAWAIEILSAPAGKSARYFDRFSDRDVLPHRAECGSTPDIRGSCRGHRACHPAHSR